jgi:hypothetical protein
MTFTMGEAAAFHVFEHVDETREKGMDTHLILG